MEETRPSLWDAQFKCLHQTSAEQKGIRRLKTTFAKVSLFLWQVHLKWLSRKREKICVVMETIWSWSTQSRNLNAARRSCHMLRLQMAATVKTLHNLQRQTHKSTLIWHDWTQHAHVYQPQAFHQIKRTPKESNLLHKTSKSLSTFQQAWELFPL